MNLKWKEISKGTHQAEVEDRVFQIQKSGAVWELIEVISSSLHSQNKIYAYISNTKSLLTARSLIKKYANKEIYFDEKCRPKQSA